MKTLHNFRKKKIIILLFFFSLTLINNTANSETSTASSHQNNNSLTLFRDDYTKNTKNNLSIVHCNGTHRQPLKTWTFIVYMAADNDLRSFAANNIKQMTSIGSNERVNIVIHLDIRLSNNQKITRRYFIEQNKLIHVNTNDPESQQMDSGDAKTLISCCKWAIESYPAQHYALILWNHGTGIIDPLRGRIFNPAELFTFNPITHKLELDRSTGFLDLINSPLQDKRGICWDNSTGNYLTNQKLNAALQEICSQYLQGNKFSIIGFDACLMAMLEVANITKNYAHIMIGSQEVELGMGWDYAKVLELFLHTNPDPVTFAQHSIQMFEKVYNSLTNDFTQSAINLDTIEALEENVHITAGFLLECLKKQNNNSVINAIKASRNKLSLTHFDEPSYVDLHHLYLNLLTNVKSFSLNNKQDEAFYKQQLTNVLEQGKSFIERIAFANTNGSNLRNARGISIYFPERKIHASYLYTNFASSNNWTMLLHNYLLG